jgi:hemerythrin superfamily protein
MNAIDLLTKQHREMEAALEAVSEADGAARGELFREAADALMAHVLVEEQQFYPAVNAKRTEDILLESLEEHLSLKRVLSDLVALPADADSFEPKLHVLTEQVEHHHKEEEDKLFPKVRKLLSADELNDLGDQMAAAQAKILTKKPRMLAQQQTDEAAVLSENP